MQRHEYQAYQSLKEQAQANRRVVYASAKKPVEWWRKYVILVWLAAVIGALIYGESTK
jgi:hypothetical protein